MTPPTHAPTTAPTSTGAAAAVVGDADADVAVGPAAAVIDATNDVVPGPTVVPEVLLYKSTALDNK